MATTRSELKDYLNTAKELAVLVSENVDQINELRRIPRHVSDAIAKEGFFRLLMPRELGGAELEHPYFLKIVHIFGVIDGSTAWCINQNNVFATNSTRMTAEAVEKIYVDPLAVVTNGPPSSSTRALITEEGYSLTGHWNFSSGSRHGTWIAALSPIGEETGSKDPTQSREGMRVLLLQQEQAEMIDTWQVNGLRGTGSFSFKIDNLSIPNEMTYDPNGKPKYCNPLYSIPTTLLFSSGFATVALGCARAALDAAIELSSTKRPGFSKNHLYQDITTQRNIGNAEAIWGSAKAYLKECTDQVWSAVNTEGSLTTEQRIRLRLASTYGIRKAVEVTGMAYTLCGSTSIFEFSPIQRRFQDVNVISQQIQGRLTHYDSAGQFFLGMEPEGIF